jgi:hypothetical protein
MSHDLAHGLPDHRCELERFGFAVQRAGKQFADVVAGDEINRPDALPLGMGGLKGLDQGSLLPHLAELIL